MKKTIKPLIPVTAAFLAGIILSCTGEDLPVEIQLNITEVTLAQGQTVSLVAGGLSDADAQDISWSSLDPSVASVENGVVTAVSAGETYILASFNALSRGCHVTVFSAVDGVSIDKDVLYLSPGESGVLVASVSPGDARNQGLLWASSDESVAVVSEDGVVTALVTGSSIISVTTEDGGYTAECEVKVMTLPVNLVLSPVEMTIDAGETMAVIATVYPVGEFTRSDLIWTSTDPRIASVDGDGNVKGVSRGTCTVLATTVANGITASCDVTVISRVKGISFDMTSAEMYVGDFLQIPVVFSPADADNQNLSWRSSDTDIVQVSDRGVVSAVAVGSAVITAVSEDGGYTAECRVTVKKGDLPVTGVSLSTSSVRIVTGRWYDLIPTVTPNAAGNKKVIWSAANPEIASVDSYGRVTAGLKAGVTFITVTTEEGGFTASCSVTVVNYDSGLPGYDDSDYEWK
ncbi:MAG: Ig-like domain-containing protein [Bacteroidales bacterium]|nr:Ig-like domain-containing protein [Bacteroidales bacterium]MDE7127598.1 Ig-like domain-containing protein [Bacteroidales bacterium]